MIIHLSNGWHVITNDLDVLDDYYNGEDVIRVEAEDKVYHITREQIVCIMEVPNFVRR